MTRAFDDLYALYALQPALWRWLIVALALNVAIVAFACAWALIEFGIDALLPVKGLRLRVPKRQRTFTDEDVARLLAELPPPDPARDRLIYSLMKTTTPANVLPFPGDPRRV